MIYNQIPFFYTKLLMDELNLSYPEKNKKNKKKLAENIIS
jgi:hypothetical protein